MGEGRVTPPPILIPELLEEMAQQAKALKRTQEALKRC